MDFDSRDETGAAISRIKEEDSRTIGGEILLSVAASILGRALPELPSDASSGGTRHYPNLAHTLRLIASMNGDLARNYYPARILNTWKWDGLTDNERERIFSSNQLIRWITFLRESYLLCLAIPGQPGQRKVIKISYQTTLRAGEASGVGFKDWIWERFGWKDWDLEIDVPAGDSASYHCEVHVPGGTKIRPFNDGGFRDAKVVSKSDCSHLAVSRCPQDADYVIDNHICARPGGWMISALVSSVAVTILLFLSWCFFAQLTAKDGNPKSDPIFLAGTLFLASAAAIITILVRTDEHDLTSRLLRFLRAAVSTIIVFCFGAALIMAFWIRSSCAEKILLYASITSLLPVVIIAKAAWHAREK